MARTSTALGKCWCGVTRALESTCQVGWGYCYICTVLCTNCLRQEYLCKTVWWRIWAHFVALCHWQECASHRLPCSLCPRLSSSQQLLDLRCPILWPPTGNMHYLVLSAWLGSAKLSRLSCCWCSGESPDLWVLTATVSHPHLTSKLQHSPDGAQKVPTQGAQVLLTTSLTCHADVCTALSFLTEAISAGFSGLFELCDDTLSWEFSFETKSSLQSIYWLLKRHKEGGSGYKKASVASLVHVIEIVSCKLLMIHMR